MPSDSLDNPAKLNVAPDTAAQPAGCGAAAMELLAIAEHPLAGQAVNDFAAVEPQYVPPAIDPAEQEDVASAVAGALMKFNDGKRLLRFFSPLKGEKTLLIESLNGFSAISDQFVFNLSLISEHAAIDLKDLMGKNVSVSVQLADGSGHFINGYVHSFGFSHSDGGFAFYHAQIVPWLSYLKQRVNSRIFQDQSVLDVLDTIFKGDYNALACYEFRISQTYRPETYIVQYNETDEHFVSRLMEKYGLFYYFEHKPNGHVMVISDDSRSHRFCPPQAHHAEVESVKATTTSSCCRCGTAPATIISNAARATSTTIRSRPSAARFPTGRAARTRRRGCPVPRRQRWSGRRARRSTRTDSAASRCNSTGTATAAATSAARAGSAYRSPGPDGAGARFRFPASDRK
jgi:hypothetical protein